jgi:iron complex outermembrane recepter protein
MRHKKTHPLRFAILLSCCANVCAQSVQRAATDAFGTRIGDESVGLYSEGQVRGFSLQEAGNYRIEDAYFVRGARLLSNSVVGGTTVRIGPNALGFDFPSPSGVVQYSLLSDARDRSELQLGLADALQSNSRPFARGYFSRKSASGNSISAGLVAFPNERYSDGVEASFYSLGFVARVQPVESLQLTALVDVADWQRNGDQLYAIADQTQAAPRARWFNYLGQEWNRSHTKDRNLGLISRYRGIANWTLSASSIVSQTDVPIYGFSLFNLAPNGDASARAIVNQGRVVIGGGHELKAVRQLASENTRSQINLSTRIRRSDFQSPQSDVFTTPSFSIFAPAPQIARPESVAPDTFSRSSTDQEDVGIAYQWRHKNQLAFNLGLRSISTTLSNAPLAAPPSKLQDRSTLYNAALVLPIAKNLTAFATTTRGLEEAGFAPANAANRFAALAPVQSKQTELGLKWQASETLSAIVTGFDLSKPDAGLAADGRFDYIGDVRHRGVEASFAGAITEQWNIVAGAMRMTPRLSGDNVARGLIGDEPVGRSAELGLLSFSYVPSPNSWSVDASLNYFGRRPANAINSRYTGGNSTLALGLRYPFKFGTLPAQWRVRLFNAGNHFAWVAMTNGLQSFSAPRRLDVQLILGE